LFFLSCWVLGLFLFQSAVKILLLMISIRIGVWLLKGNLFQELGWFPCWFNLSFDCFLLVGFWWCSDGDGMGKREEQWTEILSWEPRAFLYHNFLVGFMHFLKLNLCNKIRVRWFIDNGLLLMSCGLPD